MKVVINKSDFSGIGTAVFYKKHKFFPSDFNIIPEEDRNELNYTSDLIKYHGSSHNFPSINFAEYDFSYLVNKYKFDNRLLIAELDRTSQNLIGKDINDTDKIEKILFPTLIEDDETSLKYFGSMEVNNRNIFFFETPENYNKIEIYDEILDSNISEDGDSFIEYEYLELSGIYEETRIMPSIVIYLGPEKEYLNNPTNMYYDEDPMRTLTHRREVGGERKGDLVYSRLIDEIMGMKVVYLLLATNSAIIDFNVALSAWNNNENPNRNKWKYNIRNDEYYNAKRDISIVEKDNNIYLDKKSDTILGNEVISSACPIKNKKLNKLQCEYFSETDTYSLGEEVLYMNQIWTSNISFNRGNYPSEESQYWTLSNREYPSQFYSPYRKYMKGEITKYLKDPESNKYMVWESLIDNNYNNDPLLSPSWILSKKFLDFKTHIIYINTNPNNTGSTLNPNSQITVNSNTNVTFNIEEGLGYKFNSINLIGANNDIIDLEEGVDYTYTEIDTTNEYNKFVNISDWSEIIDEESEKYSNNLTFNFIENPSILNLKFDKDGTIYNLYEIQNLYNNGFNLDVYIGGLNYNIPETGKLIIEHPETNPSILMNYSGTMRLHRIVSKSRLGSQFNTQNISFNDGTINEVVDFSEATYLFYVTAEQREIILRAREWYNINSQSSMVDYGTTYNLEFSTDRNPIVHICTFHRDHGNIIKDDFSEITIDTYPRYNIEINGPGEITIASFERLEGNNYRFSTNNINNNLYINLE